MGGCINEVSESKQSKRQQKHNSAPQDVLPKPQAKAQVRQKSLPKTFQFDRQQFQKLQPRSFPQYLRLKSRQAIRGSFYDPVKVEHIYSGNTFELSILNRQKLGEKLPPLANALAVLRKNRLMDIDSLYYDQNHVYILQEERPGQLLPTHLCKSPFNELQARYCLFKVLQLLLKLRQLHLGDFGFELDSFCIRDKEVAVARLSMGRSSTLSRKSHSLQEMFANYAHFAMSGRLPFYHASRGYVLKSDANFPHLSLVGRRYLQFLFSSSSLSDMASAQYFQAQLNSLEKQNQLAQRLAIALNLYCLTRLLKRGESDADQLQKLAGKLRSIGGGESLNIFIELRNSLIDEQNILSLVNPGERAELGHLGDRVKTIFRENGVKRGLSLLQEVRQRQLNPVDLDEIAANLAGFFQQPHLVELSLIQDQQSASKALTQLTKQQ